MTAPESMCIAAHETSAINAEFCTLTMSGIIPPLGNILCAIRECEGAMTISLAAMELAFVDRAIGICDD